MWYTIIMNTLYLLQSEQSLLDGIQSDVKDGCTVQETEMTYEDTPEKRVARLRLLHFENSGIKDLQAKAIKATTEDELQGIATSFDFAKLSQHDLTEIFYAMGPDVMTSLITKQLPTVQTKDDLDGVAAISTFRHFLFGPQ